ncbi:hypothetical protein H1P_2110007 [Hyella patelloides LEGE 07179]|uniref:Uncharacterized protein n=1 Tax=Hyella patelloides LEGE 07179 TaxID=945734 RepID=A0A563VQD9_9CYAN|nr:hypothetical protein [Hyella patelloides]VEP13682.1 hypothetical protein H1P_2110007 [Hyella patelloides LEGE 07179]
MNNLPNDGVPTKQTLPEAPEEVVSDRETAWLALDRISSQPESHLIKTQSTQTSKDMNIDHQLENDNTVVQTSQDMTIAQVANPVSQVENDNTVVQTSEDMTIAQVANPISQVENDNTVVQHSDSVIQNRADRTVVQYSDSPIHNSIHSSAEQKVNRAKSPLSTNLDRQSRRQNFSQPLISTIVRENRGNFRLFHPSMFRNVFRNMSRNMSRNIFGTSSSPISRSISITRRFLNSIWRKIGFKQPQSRLLLGSREKTLEQPSSNSLNRSTYNTVTSNEQLGSEQYQKKLRELDLCRLNFAKELARNGKFRKAIAEAEQISAMSYLFQDAQRLIQSWKQF